MKNEREDLIRSIREQLEKPHVNSYANEILSRLEIMKNEKDD